MLLASIEFTRTVNGKGMDKHYNALSKIFLGDMRNFYQTDEGKEYYKEWIKRNRELIDEYGSSDEITYAGDDEDDDD